MMNKTPEIKTGTQNRYTIYGQSACGIYEVICLRNAVKKKKISSYPYKPFYYASHVYASYITQCFRKLLTLAF